MVLIDYGRKKVKLVLSLGGNIGEVKSNFKKAMELLEERVGAIKMKSSVYKTEAWGNEDQPAFLNQVLVLVTKRTPIEVLNLCLQIEKEIGRVRKGKKRWTPRLIDIDLLFYGKEVIEMEKLQVPHPYLHERNFILFPLEEILPNFSHPILNKTMLEIKRECRDTLNAIKVKNN